MFAGQKTLDILISNLNYIRQAYRLARLVVFISKFLFSLTTTVICSFIIEISPTLRNNFLTNIIILIFSYFIVSFAFDSYDRSFEVILITILTAEEDRVEKAKSTLWKTECEDPEKYKNYKKSLCNKVLEWFK